MSLKTVSIGSDHGGLELKNLLCGYMAKEGFKMLDRGTNSRDSVDYPDYASAVCKDVLEGGADFGILICTTGIGMSMAANKIKGIRAALCHNADCAMYSRRHNNANVLCMGEKYVDFKSACEIASVFSNTPFDGERHLRRVKKFMEFENS